MAKRPGAHLVAEAAGDRDESHRELTRAARLAIELLEPVGLRVTAVTANRASAVRLAQAAVAR
ncbi:hypothetical protein AB0G54_31685 [Streptomyces yokosukanensis]|uniref:hypothetical protein n=1 Tax=Streptomyces yokosukanensis TaxID=67386 RepID=UPI0034334159